MTWGGETGTLPQRRLKACVGEISGGLNEESPGEFKTLLTKSMPAATHIFLAEPTRGGGAEGTACDSSEPKAPGLKLIGSGPQPSELFLGRMVPKAIRLGKCILV